MEIMRITVWLTLFIVTLELVGVTVKNMQLPSTEKLTEIILTQCDSLNSSSLPMFVPP